MANAIRGEREVKINDRYFTLFPTVNAMVNIEDALGLGTAAIMIQLCPPSPGLKVSSVVIYYCIKANPAHAKDASVTIDFIREGLFKMPAHEYGRIVTDILGEFLKGDDSVPASSEDEKKQ